MFVISLNDQETGLDNNNNNYYNQETGLDDNNDNYNQESAGIIFMTMTASALLIKQLTEED